MNTGKEKIFEILKFIPVTYKIELTGYGGAIVMGKISKKAYEYFKNNDIDLAEFAYDDDNELNVPEDCRPFEPGMWHECDDLCNQTNVEMSSLSYVTIYDENNEIVFQSDLNTDTLEKNNINIEECEEIYVVDQPGITYVYFGQIFEKGLFFSGELKLTKPFDITKLKFYYGDYEGWLICNSVTYDEEDIENQDIDTSGKGTNHLLLCSENN